MSLGNWPRDARETLLEAGRLSAARRRPSVSCCALVERVIGEPLPSIRPLAALRSRGRAALLNMRVSGGKSRVFGMRANERLTAVGGGAGCARPGDTTNNLKSPIARTHASCATCAQLASVL